MKASLLLQKWRRFFVRENRIYIMPTGSGILVLVLILVMVLTAATYSNNLIFLLSFFLFSAFLTMMVQTHYLLKGVRLTFKSAEDAFQGERLVLLFHLTQKRARLRQGLIIRTDSKKFRTVTNRRETMTPSELTIPARIEVLAWRRGVHTLPEMILETRYPLGLFRAWKIFRPEGEFFVYPKPVGTVHLPQNSYDFGEEDFGLRNSPEGDFGELKAYQDGESYHQIAWKHYARSGELYTKVHWGQEHRHYQIPWRPTRDLEIYLMQMSHWVQAAFEENASFEMETPLQKIESGRGIEHRQLCLRALAAVTRSA